MQSTRRRGSLHETDYELGVKSAWIPDSSSERFLLKDAPQDQLVSAIRVIATGGSLFAPSVTRRLIEEPPR